jgi:hypothetical protein
LDEIILLILDKRIKTVVFNEEIEREEISKDK